MNEQLIIKMAMPFVRDGYLTLEQFDVIYYMLSKREQYQVIDILNRHDIEIIDENEELTLLSSVNIIVTLAEDSGLNAMFFEKADRFISYFSERQGITKIQAVLLALFIESSAAGNKSDFSDVARYLDCNSVQVLQYKGEVDDLVRKGMLRMIRNNMNGSYDYAVTQSFLESLAKNEPFQRKSYKNASGIQFCRDSIISGKPR